jgi:hypothetical protein
MVEKIFDVTQESPGEVLADAGYRSEANLQGLEDKRIDGYISLGREGSAKQTNVHSPATLAKKSATAR